MADFTQLNSRVGRSYPAPHQKLRPLAEKEDPSQTSAKSSSVKATSSKKFINPVRGVSSPRGGAEGGGGLNF